MARPVIVILSAKAASSPLTASASTRAASFEERTSAACRATRSEIVSPAFNPSATGGAAAAWEETVIA